MVSTNLTAVQSAAPAHDHGAGTPSIWHSAVSEEHGSQCTISTSTASSSFSTVSGLDESSMQALQRLYTGGVKDGNKIWRLTYAGEVANDGNCLFSALSVSLGLPAATGAAELRRRAVERFLSEYRALPDAQQRRAADEQVRNLYHPDLTRGWGVHFVQQRKLLLPVEDQARAAAAIADLVGGAGMDAAAAAESVYGDLALPVDCCERWALYMGSTVVAGGSGGIDISSSGLEVGAVDSSIASAAEAASAAMETDERGAAEGDGPCHLKQQQQQHGREGEGEQQLQQQQQYVVVNLQYVEEGLLSAELETGSAAFGDDLAIDALARALSRDIYVVQAHAQDAVDASTTDGGLFFLPHRASPPNADNDDASAAGAATAPPLFLLMKGSDWTAVGGDHYDPLLTSKSPDGVAPLAKPYDLSLA